MQEPRACLARSFSIGSPRANGLHLVQMTRSRVRELDQQSPPNHGLLAFEMPLREADARSRI